MTILKRKALILNIKDNVASALIDLEEGERVEISRLPGDNIIITLVDGIQLGHKFALEAIKLGDDVLKNGMSIGTTSKDIKKGEHVHIHNVTQIDGDSIVENVGEK